MSSITRPPPAPELAQLCEDAALPSAERHAHADALFEIVSTTKALQSMLDRGRDASADVLHVRHAIAAALAVDALSDRRPVSSAERQRIDDVVTYALARDDIDAEQKALALAARARMRLLIGEAELAVADLEHALSLLKPEDEANVRVRAFVAARYGYALMTVARLDDSLAAHRRSSELAHECGDAHAFVSALQDEGNLLHQLGQIEDARARFNTSRERALASGDAAGEMRAYAGIAFGHLDAREFEASRDAYAAAVAIGERGVAPRLHALVLGYSAILHLEHDRMERAIALSARAVANSSRLGFRLGEGFFASVQAAAHARRGDLESADDRMRFARGRVPPEHSYLHIIRLYDALVEVERGGQHAIDQASALLDELSEARTGSGETRAFVERIDDARVAARILRGRLRERGDEETEATHEQIETKALASRLDARRMLSYLRVQSGKPMPALDLARYVWPRELFDEASARTRIDALIATMTHEGFDEVVLVDADNGVTISDKP